MSPIAFPFSVAAVLHGPDDLRIEQRPLRPPRAGEAQVAVLATGICGSDLHYFQHGRNGDFALRAPLVLGHEAAGVIIALGDGVAHLHVGQRVAIEAGVMCRSCTHCLGGRYNLCSRLRFASSAKTFPHLDGTLQTIMNHPAHVLHPLPENCSFERAALAEPLSVVLHAMRRAGLQPGQNVLVLGAGTIGLLACALARALGASRIAVADINPARLEWAHAHGVADNIYRVPQPSPAPPPPPPSLKAPPAATGARDDTAAAASLRRAAEGAKELMHACEAPEGFDIVMECTGAESSAQLAIHAARTGGKLMLVGMGTPVMQLPISAAATREVDVLGTFRYANTYASALAMLCAGVLRGVDALVTHRVALDRARDAFDLVRRGTDASGKLVLKVIVEPSNL